MMAIVKKLSISIKSALNADGINIEMNNDAPAGQLIFHTHIHIIPRFSGDGLKHWPSPRDYNEDELFETGRNIKMQLSIAM